MDIMNRLLMKSLLQFHAVSKQWKFSIDSFDFIHNYGCRETNTCCFNLSFMHNLQGYIHSFDENLAFRNFDSNLDLFSLKPVASSEGIWCFSFSENSFLVLWNPSMKKSVAISVPNYIRQPDSPKMIFGFGICPVLVGEFSPPYYISQLGDSLIISGSFGFGAFRIIYAWALDFQDGLISSCSLLFNIPHLEGHYLKLLGFTHSNQPIVEAEIVQQWYRSLQVFHPIVEGFVNIGVEANRDSFFIGPHKESLILLNEPRFRIVFTVLIVIYKECLRLPTIVVDYIAIMKMAPYEAFACRCGKGDVVLRESYQPNTRGKLYYACPRSKPKENDYGCKFFLWKEERVRLLISSPGSSSTASYYSEPSPPNSYSSGTTTPQNHHL
ncbi:F-box domain containing protein [Tanacetum coccineum]